MTDVSVQLRVTSVRSRGRSGGVIFAGISDAGQRYVAVCSRELVPDSSVVDKGQRWKVRGATMLRESLVNGYRTNETQIEAIIAELLWPTGRNLIGWIAQCLDCPGIGQVKAGKLYDRFGPELANIIANRDIAALETILGADAAALLCDAFTKHRISDTLLWLDRMGIRRRVGQKIADHYKEHARAKIEANPYVLIPFETEWSVIDKLARTRFDVRPDDPRRLAAAVEESLYRGYRDGHTCLPDYAVRAALATLLRSSQLSAMALANDTVSTQYRRVGAYLQATGAYLIEQYLARRLEDIAAGRDADGQACLYATAMPAGQAVAAALADHERQRSQPLAPAQRAAVLTCIGSRLSLILGGAGTGKTTVLMALYATLEQVQPGVEIHQLALAGKAAQRMAELSGRDAMTIAAFLARTNAGEIPPGTMVVVDEASMVDVILMYRLLRHLPPDIRLVLVGDPAQLPPISPGLVLHALAGVATIAQVELTVVQRQSTASGIPQVAAAIRVHQRPQCPAYRGKDAGVSFVSCSPAEIDNTVRRVYSELGGAGSDFRVQILCVTNAGTGGIDGLNRSMHERYRRGAEPVLFHDDEFGQVGAATLDRVLIKVGDLVVFTVNDYELDLRNGSLGRIVAALPAGAAGDPCCVCDFDGIPRRLTTAQAQALKHAYAITVHKSQGSQFERVIVPIRRTRLLDQALVYTAVTRAVEQVVLVGDEEAVMAAIRAPASATGRHVTLRTLMTAAWPG